MTRSRVAGLAGAAILVAVLVFAQNHAAMFMSQPKISLLAPLVTVPMDLADGHPVVQVTINGKGPFRFVLDTGAAGTVISETLQKELNLEARGEIQIHSPMGDHNLPGKLVNLGRVELGQAVISDIMAVSFDSSNVFRRENAPRGVLSANAFPGYLITFNYPESKVELRAGELPAADNAEILEFDASGPIVSLPVRIAGVEIRADLDSGSGVGIMMPAKYSSELPLSGELTQTKPARTVDGTTEQQLAMLNGAVQIGRFSIQNPEIVFNSKAPHANLGTAFLKRFVVTIDRKNHRVQLKANA